MKDEELVDRLSKLQAAVDDVRRQARRPFIGFWEALAAALLVSAAWYFGWFGLPGFELVHAENGVAKSVVKISR